MGFRLRDIIVLTATVNTKRLPPGHMYQGKIVCRASGSDVNVDSLGTATNPLVGLSGQECISWDVYISSQQLWNLVTAMGSNTATLYFYEETN